MTTEDESVTVTRMAGYAKLFSRILDSTVWREDNETRILWITMLAMADMHGNILCTIPGLADRARISLKACESALQKFQEPDKYSWSRESEGRRIRVIDGGWFLINHAKYRAMLSKDEQREKTRIRVERFRQKGVTSVTSNASNDIASTEATTTTDTKVKVKSFVRPTLEEIRVECQKRNSPVDPEHFFSYYEANGWRTGKNPMKKWQAALTTWERNGFTTPAIWRSGNVPDKRQQNRQRISDNQREILAGLGLSEGTGSSEQDLQGDDGSPRGKNLAKVLRGRTASDA